MRNVTKEIFLNALVCPTLGWLIRHEEISKKPTLGDRFRMEQGMEIGRRARELFSDGVLVDRRDITAALKKTNILMNDPGISTIFEGTFLIDNFVTKADILKRENGKWHVIEVKSSVNDKEEFIDDMAYTTMVISCAGFNVSNVSLMLISKDFRLGMKTKDLFLEIDHTSKVLGRIEEFKPLWESIGEMTSKSEKPEPELRFECRKCGLFKDCLGTGIKNHIFEIPRLSQSKFDKLRELSVFCIDDIPNEFPLTENQTRVKNCVQLKQPIISQTLKDELKTISWPAFYLDFETVSTTIPLYTDIAPYAKIPIQYSIHKCSEPGGIVNHFEYLADPSKDCRKGLVKNLINHLNGESSIIVYSNFEKTIINNLVKVYPEFLEELNFLIDRIVDLEAIIKKNFYHPDFHGRTSIKGVLPVLVPEMSYDGLEIADGDTAMTLFAHLALGKYGGDEVERIKRNLLEYCKQDTLALVKLHEYLVKSI